MPHTIFGQFLDNFWTILGSLPPQVVVPHNARDRSFHSQALCLVTLVASVAASLVEPSIHN